MTSLLTDLRLATPKKRKIAPPKKSVNPDAPRYECSNGFAALLRDNNIALLFTRQSSHRLYIVQAGEDDDVLTIDPYHFFEPKALSAVGDTIWLSSRNHLHCCINRPPILADIAQGRLDRIHEWTYKCQETHRPTELRAAWERDQVIQRAKQSERLFVEKMTLATGWLNLHDIAGNPDGDGVFAANSTHCCVVDIRPGRPIRPIWVPDFISELVPEDRCHLNGLGLRDGAPRYATAFLRGETKDCWRKQDLDQGLLIDMQDGRELCSNLLLPHSPRWDDRHQRILIGNGGAGTVLSVDPESGEASCFATPGGFIRGLAITDHLVIAGSSAPKETSIVWRSPSSTNPIEGPRITIYRRDTGAELGVVVFHHEDLRSVNDLAVVRNAKRIALVPSHHPLASYTFDIEIEAELSPGSAFAPNPKGKGGRPVRPTTAQSALIA